MSKAKYRIVANKESHFPCKVQISYGLGLFGRIWYNLDTFLEREVAERAIKSHAKERAGIDYYDEKGSRI